MKTCSTCGIEKDVEAFYKKISGRQGRTAECIDCTRTRNAEYKRRNPAIVRERTRRYNYAKHGITIELWDALLDKQGGCCAACGQENRAERNLHIDHDHECCPGTYSCGSCIRGLLCSQCNTALGLLGDDLDKVMSLAAYLVSHQNVLVVK